MKNLIITFLILMAGCQVANAQERTDDMYFSSTHKSERPVLQVGDYGNYLRKSRNFHYAAAGSAVVSAGLFVGYACLKEKFTFNEEGDATMKSNAKGYLIGGGIIGLAALICEFNAIHYQFKAGQCLELKAEEGGAGVSFRF